MRTFRQRVRHVKHGCDALRRGRLLLSIVLLTLLLLAGLAVLGVKPLVVISVVVNFFGAPR